MLIRSGALDIIVIDSVAALVPRAEIEGEMGDSHVGLQARLMSQALRKITGALNNSSTTAIFINQLREKIGVMFGCFSYSTRVTLADGTQEKIGKIVNQKLPVEVLSYDPDADRIVPAQGHQLVRQRPDRQFLQFTVAKSGGNGRAQFAATANHLVRTPGGWREAGELIAGDRVMLAETRRLSDQQWQVVLGGADGRRQPVAEPPRPQRRPVPAGPRRAAGRLPRLEGVAARQHRLQPAHRTPRARSSPTSPRCRSWASCSEAVYLGDGKKHLTWDYLKALTPLALAVWYMDDGASRSGPRAFSSAPRAAAGGSSSASRR